MYGKLMRIVRIDDPRFSLVTALVGAMAGWGAIGFSIALTITALIAVFGKDLKTKFEDKKLESEKA